MRKFDKDGILDRLYQLDDDLLALYPGEEPFDLVILGGSALVLRSLAPGKVLTVDIDALHADSRLESLFARYDINTDADTFRFRFPSRFRERLVEVPFDGAMLRVFTLSNEDLVIAKMLAWRDQDKEDISSMLAAGNIDIEGLHAIIDDITELEPNLDDEQWEAFRERVDELESWADR